MCLYGDINLLYILDVVSLSGYMYTINSLKTTGPM